MSKELVKISWYSADKTFGDWGRDAFCINRKTNKILDEYEDTDHIENPIFFTIDGVNEFMSQMIEDDKSDFVADELTTKVILEHIERIMKPEVGLNSLISLIRYEKPEFGEFVLIYNFHSYRCNHPQDPEEWDIDLDCEGVLDYDFKIVKI